MFARHTSFRLKSLDMSSSFARAFEDEILPLLRQQKGFVGELALANPCSMERVAISLWASEADADAYLAKTYPAVLKILAKTIEGTPKVHTFDSVTAAFLNWAE